MLRVHYDWHNAPCTMLHDVMHAIQDLYAMECPLGLCVLEFICTCLLALTLTHVPLNFIKHSPRDIPMCKRKAPNHTESDLEKKYGQ